jgi:hypothetical protein
MHSGGNNLITYISWPATCDRIWWRVKRRN